MQNYDVSNDNEEISYIKVPEIEDLILLDAELHSKCMIFDNPQADLRHRTLSSMSSLIDH